MKLHKNKYRILIAGIVILTIFTSVLCSFTPHVPSSTIFSISPSDITIYDAENLLSTAMLQYSYGSFNNSEPLVCIVYQGGIRLFCGKIGGNTYSVSNTEITITSSTADISRYWFTATGFGLQYTSNSTTVDFSSVLFYKNNNGQLVVNESFNFNTSIDNHDVFSEAASSWFEAWDKIINYESNIAAAESQGYSNGYEEAAESSYQNGYSTGFNDGYTFGDQNGYNRGYHLGYDNGYDTGYDVGYNIGYDDGLDGAEPGDPEIVTEIIYRDPVEIDIGKVISGVGSIPKSIINSSFDIDIFGLNIAGLLAALIIIVVTIFVIKKLKA